MIRETAKDGPSTILTPAGARIHSMCMDLALEAIVALCRTQLADLQRSHVNPSSLGNAEEGAYGPEVRLSIALVNTCQQIGHLRR